MRFRSSTLLVLIFIFMAGFISTIAHSKGGPITPAKKISDISWGRFVSWPAYVDQSSATEFYEDDLFKRVHADYIRRSHKDLLNMKEIPWWIWKDWSLNFGAAASSDTIGNIPEFNDEISTDPEIVNAWSLEQNWVYKKFAVVREGATNADVVATGDPDCPYEGREYTYSVSVNCLSPGTRIQTKNDIFYLKNDDHGFGYLSYQNTDNNNIVIGDFADSDTHQAIFLGSLGENWVLLFDTMDEDLRMFNVQIPVLISFSHEPVISCDADYIKFNFVNKDPSDELTVFISLAYGVDIADNAAVPPSGWTNELPAEVITRCRLINRMANNWPIDVEETFKFKNARGITPERVIIENSFSFSYMGSNWGVNPSPYAVFPPLLALADTKDMGIYIPTGAIDTGIPTKIGPLLIIDNEYEAEYEIPGAPKHDVHFVGTHQETEWKQKLNRMINASSLTPQKYWVDADGTMNASVLTAANNRGEAASLAMTREWTKAHYVDWMQQIIDGHMFNSMLGEWKYYEHIHSAPPAEGEWPAFWAFSDPTSTKAPWDIDATAGTALEFIYEYGLWSGNWEDLNDDYWDNGDVNITEIFRSLEIFQDWAYMASPLTIYGGCGAIMDMFNAQLEGYYAYAKIAEALGKEDEAGWGRYLAAKAQIPFIMRWASKDYIEQYYKTDPTGYTQIISGFGEVEPSGPLYSNYNQVYILEDWADWTISGERFHPLGFDVLSSLSGDYFKNILILFDNEFDNIVNSMSDIMPASFGENKIYGFYRWRNAEPARWSREELENIVSLYCTDFSSSSSSNFEGPSHYYKVFFSQDYDWYDINGPTGNWGVSPHTSKAQIYPLLPAIMEAYYVPVRVGSWAPAVLDSASYDWETETFTAHFSRPLLLPGNSPEPIVRLQVDSEPTQISGDVDISGDPYDPIWKVVEIPLAGGLSEWSITATIPPPSNAEWNSVPANPNLISDPGFEESGTGDAITPHPNMEMGWKLYPHIDEYYELAEIGPGNQCACLYKFVDDTGTNPSMYQYLWVGPTDTDEGPHHINVEFDYRFDPENMDILDEYFMWLSVTAHSKDLGGNTESEWVLREVLTCGDESCVNNWQHFSSGTLTVTPTNDIVNSVIKIAFYVQDNLANPTWTPDSFHGVCLDNVVITCDELDMGSDGGPSLSSPKPASAPPLPVLSNFVSYPNPFNPSVSISFEMGRRNHALLNIYDVSGRLVKTLVDKTLSEGRHSFLWNGKNNRGVTTSSGIYFYRLNVADKEAKGKLILLR